MSTASTGRTAEFVSAHGRAIVLRTLFVAFIVVAAVSVLSTLSEINLLSRAMSGAQITAAEAEANDSRQQLLAALWLISYLSTAVVFLVWIRRAYSNLQALGASALRYSSRWAVGGFFVPILNLSRPYQVMSEIWRESVPKSVTRPTSLVKLWWGLFLVSNFMGYLSSRAATQGASDLFDLLADSWLSAISDVITLAAAVVTVVLVMTIDAMQAERSTGRLEVTPGEWSG